MPPWYLYSFAETYIGSKISSVRNKQYLEHITKGRYNLNIFTLYPVKLWYTSNNTTKMTCFFRFLMYIMTKRHMTRMKPKNDCRLCGPPHYPCHQQLCYNIQLIVYEWRFSVRGYLPAGLLAPLYPTPFYSKWQMWLFKGFREGIIHPPTATVDLDRICASIVVSEDACRGSVHTVAKTILSGSYESSDEINDSIATMNNTRATVKRSSRSDRVRPRGCPKGNHP